MSVSILLAIGSNGELGYKDGLPWDRISHDMKYFKQLTTGNIVVMGRKTWDAIGYLPNRQNVVLTRSHVSSLSADKHGRVPDAVINSLDNIPFEHDKTTFIIGGAEVYKSVLNTNFSKSFYITSVNPKTKPLQCDTWLKDYLDFIPKSQLIDEYTSPDYDVKYYKLEDD